MPKTTYYCLCRTTDAHGFMIACDHCQEWFHGKCINVTKLAAESINHYYCDECRRVNPSLSIVYEDQTKITITDSKPKAKPKVLTQKKISPVKLKAQKNKSRKQCSNPDCVYETRQDSKYCSDECGTSFNKLRYDTFFIPKWKALTENHSKARLKRMQDLEQLEKDEIETLQLIENLKAEQEEVERNIVLIKDDAKKQLLVKKREAPKPNNDDESDIDEDLTSDQTRTFCITCGAPQAHNVFKHWTACHKKHEAVYNFTADGVANHGYEEITPKLYCHFQDKKTRRYCMHIATACPQHSNWQIDKDEVCACPLKIMQKLEPDGNYCLELRKDCTRHYHWDKFRVAQLNMQRINAFNKLDSIRDKIRLTGENFRDSYGGVVGVMLHSTHDHLLKKDESPEEDVDVDMAVD